MCGVDTRLAGMLPERWVEATDGAMDGGPGAERQALTPQWKLPLLLLQAEDRSPVGLLGERDQVSEQVAGAPQQKVTLCNRSRIQVPLEGTSSSRQCWLRALL